ncbi:hypothetical protein DL546_005276 [Coniochaeta pulveracea]|uniref:Uncharacterized protein n=1 Tax=Coniochaeta pulveracea TaxID=177199 RepID=A0A420Y7Z6_9PEZI|nr:hypothetical protein DL546_005276 [Coniochaeta pulveracea]
MNSSEIPLDDVEYDSDGNSDPEQASMAAMMGFTSFGSQSRPSKKRRYNPRADAGFAEDSGTGANTLPLMPRQPRTETTGAGIAGAAGKVVAKRTLQKSEDRGGVAKEKTNDAEIDLDEEEDDPEPQYIDTSRSPRRTTDEAVGVAPGLLLPMKPSFGGQQLHQSGAGRGGHERRMWYTDYYDPSSNENPWEGLEKAGGLIPVGTWLERGHAGVVGKGRSG